MEERQNKTPRDAYDRVLDAKIGSLAGGATDDYLLALQRELHKWLATINEELAARMERADCADRECPCCGDPRTEHERALQWACAACRAEEDGDDR
jgi:hypothetical protein